MTAPLIHIPPPEGLYAEPVTLVDGITVTVEPALV